MQLHSLCVIPDNPVSSGYLISLVRFTSKHCSARALSRAKSHNLYQSIVSSLWRYLQWNKQCWVHPSSVYAGTWLLRAGWRACCGGPFSVDASGCPGSSSLGSMRAPVCTAAHLSAGAARTRLAKSLQPWCSCAALMGERARTVRVCADVEMDQCF